MTPIDEARQAVLLLMKALLESELPDFRHVEHSTYEMPVGHTHLENSALCLICKVYYLEANMMFPRAEDVQDIFSRLSVYLSKQLEQIVAVRQLMAERTPQHTVAESLLTHQDISG